MNEITQIKNVLAAYNEQYRTITINDLLAARDKLSILSFTLAESDATLKTDYNNKRFIRKIEFARAKNEFMNKHAYSGTKAESEAESALEMEYREEMEAEANAYKCQVLLRQVNQVLEAMKQRISHLRKEYEDSKNQV
jgi:hypothetical protein